MGCSCVLKILLTLSCCMLCATRSAETEPGIFFRSNFRRSNRSCMTTFVCCFTNGWSSSYAISMVHCTSVAGVIYPHRVYTGDWTSPQCDYRERRICPVVVEGAIICLLRAGPFPLGAVGLNRNGSSALLSCLANANQKRSI